MAFTSNMPLSGALVALLPVLCFLTTLLYLDSYKLVKLRTVVGLVCLGAVTAIASYFVSDWLLNSDSMGFEASIGFEAFTRYVSPVTEEILKGAIILAMIRSHRIGFLVDAAILGFAIGSGFATVENLYFLHIFPDAGMATWIVRGFGTAIMHGGATAIFAVLGMVMLEQKSTGSGLAYLPGLVLAVLLHSAFNHLIHTPRFATLAIVLLLPILFYAAFQRSEKAVGEWLGLGFDTDAEMLELINSGRFSDSPVGQYLHTLKARFSGPVVADLLCYLRLYTELALRAKGILIMRENGFKVPLDDETKAKFAELRFLEQSIGKTGLLAMQPMLHIRHKDLWQLFLL